MTMTDHDAISAEDPTFLHFHSQENYPEVGAHGGRGPASDLHLRSWQFIESRMLYERSR